MKEVMLKITETHRYEREVPVEIPDDWNEDTLNKALSEAEERANSADDIIAVLKRKYDCTSSGNYDKSLDCPDYSEAECEDYDFVD